MDLSQRFASLSPDEQKAFYHGPAMKAPPGIIPNFENPPNKNTLMAGIIIACGVLSTVSVCIRLYLRIFTGNSITLRVEDYLVILAWGSLAVSLYYAWALISSAGLYVHQWNIHYIDFVAFMHHINTITIIYGPIIGLTKTAILLDWRRFFIPHPVRNTSLLRIIYIVIALNCGWYVVGTVLTAFSCLPRKKYWDQTVAGKCVNPHISLVASGVINMVSDFVMLGIPQKVIWSLHMKWSRKLGTSSLFAIGIFACICAVARLVYSIKVFLHHDDATFAISRAAPWTLGEITFGFLLVGIPSLPQLTRDVKWMRWTFTMIKSWSQSLSKDARKRSSTSIKMTSSTAQLRNSLSGDFEHEARVENNPASKVVV